jgi:hypothetical protein
MVRATGSRRSASRHAGPSASAPPGDNIDARRLRELFWLSTRLRAGGGAGARGSSRTGDEAQAAHARFTPPAGSRIGLAPSPRMVSMVAAGSNNGADTHLTTAPSVMQPWHAEPISGYGFADRRTVPRARRHRGPVGRSGDPCRARADGSILRYPRGVGVPGGASSRHRLLVPAPAWPPTAYPRVRSRSASPRRAGDRPAPLPPGSGDEERQECAVRRRGDLVTKAVRKRDVWEKQPRHDACCAFPSARP